MSKLFVFIVVIVALAVLLKPGLVLRISALSSLMAGLSAIVLVASASDLFILMPLRYSVLEKEAVFDRIYLP